LSLNTSKPSRGPGRVNRSLCPCHLQWLHLLLKSRILLLYGSLLLGKLSLLLKPFKLLDAK
jgi:hypothetical protein